MLRFFAALLCLLVSAASADEYRSLVGPTPLGSAVSNFGGLQFAIAPGGIGPPGGVMSGYVTGDSITLQCPGVTFSTPPIIGVTLAAGGAVTGSVVINPGVTSASASLPSGSLPCSQASATGNGTGYTVTATFGVIASYLSVPTLSTGGSSNNGNLFLTSNSPGYNIGATVSSAAITAGGTGYGNTLTGTLTYSGAGCTTSPVLNVTTNSSGVVTTLNSITISGQCPAFPTSPNTSWTAGGGLSAGSGVSITLTAPGWASAENVFVGPYAGGGFVGAGMENTALGEDSCGVYGSQFWNAPTGGFNTCIGGDAGRNIGNTAASNTLIGTGAGRNVTSSANVFVGAASGGSATNGAGPVSGGVNVGIGTLALSALTTGTQNIVAGGAGEALTTGNYNSLFGQAVGNGLIGSSGVTAIGNTADTAGTGSYGTYVGFQAGANLTSGALNVFMGATAGSRVSSGSNITALGYAVATTTLQTGGNDVIIGTSSACDASGAAASNEIDICAGSTAVIKVTGAGTPATSQSTLLGVGPIITNIATGTGSYVCGVAGQALTVEVTACPASDIAVKHDVVTIDGSDALDAVSDRRGVRFIYNEGKGSPGRHIGVIANEWEADFPELVSKDPDGTRHFDYQAAVGLLVAAVGEEKRRVDLLMIAVGILALWCVGLTFIVARRKR